MYLGNADSAAAAEKTFSMLPQTLMWATCGTEFQRVELSFARRISEALGGLLARLDAEAPAVGEQLSARMAQASGDTITRVLLSPNISQQLLWQNGPTAEIGRLLDRSLRVGNVDDGTPFCEQPSPEPFGNGSVRQAGMLTGWVFVEGRLPVDLESPDLVALGSSQPAAAQGWQPLATGDRATALESLRAAYGQVRSNSTSLESLMEVCARVVVMRQKGTADFCSFSSCHFVGRIALVNPQLVGDLVIAEALVHEAIHSFLYMQEPSPLWGLLPSVSEDPGAVVSPWTGREIATSAFLHACFVWYGLFFFWMRELRRQLAAPDAVKRHVIRAASGFMRGPLLAGVAPGRNAIMRDLVKRVLAELQANVLSVTA